MANIIQILINFSLLLMLSWCWFNDIVESSNLINTNDLDRELKRIRHEI